MITLILDICNTNGERGRLHLENVSLNEALNHLAAYAEQQVYAPNVRHNQGLIDGWKQAAADLRELNE